MNNSAADCVTRNVSFLDLRRVRSIMLFREVPRFHLHSAKLINRAAIGRRGSRFTRCFFLFSGSRGTFSHSAI